MLDTTAESHREIYKELIEESYAKLAPNQALIGVYGYFYGDWISSLGLIIMEEVKK